MRAAVEFSPPSTLPEERILSNFSVYEGFFSLSKSGHPRKSHFSPLFSAATEESDFFLFFFPSSCRVEWSEFPVVCPPLRGGTLAFSLLNRIKTGTLSLLSFRSLRISKCDLCLSGLFFLMLSSLRKSRNPLPFPSPISREKRECVPYFCSSPPHRRM